MSSVAAFNSRNLPKLPRSFTVDGAARPIVYMSISADANLDDSNANGRPTITIDEGRGTPQDTYGDLVWARILTEVYRMMGNVASTRLDERNVSGRRVPVVKEVRTPEFQFNDLLVTVNSARLRGFLELTSSDDNHATVANPANALVTIAGIRTAQPLREP